VVSARDFWERQAVRYRYRYLFLICRMGLRGAQDWGIAFGDPHSDKWADSASSKPLRKLLTITVSQVLQIDSICMLPLMRVRLKASLNGELFIELPSAGVTVSHFAFSYVCKM
jgi:hypothetical protein